jgi:phasin
VKSLSGKQEGRDMSEQNKFEIPKEIRSMAEAGVEQARKAFDMFVNAAQSAASDIEGRSQNVRDNARDLGAKAVSYAEKNVAASLDYAERLVKAKDVAEIMRLHSEYVQAQMQALAEQAREFGQTVTRSAMDATKPK